MLFCYILFILLTSKQKSLIECSDTRLGEQKPEPSKRHRNDFCTNGQLDTAVGTENGRIYIFVERNVIELSSNLRPINLNRNDFRNIFIGLNFDRMDAAFTADGVNNPKRGYTYFIRGIQVKEYLNQRPTGITGNRSQWRGGAQLKRIDLVINQIGDNIAMMLEMEREEYRVRMLIFDSVDDPTYVVAGVHLETYNLITYPISIGYILKAVIGLRNNSYLVFYNPIDTLKHGKFCLTNSLSQGV